MELSTTTRGKAKLLWKAYRKNGMIRWRCACCASKHCPASVYTDLLPANPVLKTDHNHCPEPVKLEVDRCQTDMSIRAAASNDPPTRIYVLPNCLLPKCPITKTSYYQNVRLPKCPVTEMSCYRKCPAPPACGRFPHLCCQSVCLL